MRNLQVMFIFVLVIFLLSGCQTVPERAETVTSSYENDEPHPDSSEDDTDAEGKPEDVDADDTAQALRKRQPPKEYVRWPRRLNGTPDDNFPDGPVEESDGDDPRDTPPPIFYGEELTHQDDYVFVGSHNWKGFGENKSFKYATPKGSGNNRHRDIAKFMATYVKEIGLDVVAIQEVVGKNNDAVDRIKAALGGDWEVAQGNGGSDWTREIGASGNKEWCPIFYNKLKIQEEGQKGKRLIAVIAGKQRFMSYAYLGVRPDRVNPAKQNERFKFTMTCIHAPPPGAPAVDRTAYFASLPAAVAAFAWDTDVILAGDFNANPKAPSQENRDRWNPLFTVGGFLNTHDFNNLVANKGTSIFNKNIYDDLLWRQTTDSDFAGLKVIEYGFDEMFRKADGTVDKRMQNRFSDHYAVWARFYEDHDSL